MDIDPRLSLMIVLGLVGMAVARAALAPGMHRRALMSLLAAVCLSPAFVGGHGLGVTSAAVLVFAPNPQTGSWDPGAGYGLLAFIGAVWIVSFGIGSVAALFVRKRPEPQTDRPIPRQQVGFVIVMHALSVCAFAGSILYRLHRRDARSSYGPENAITDDLASTSGNWVPYFCGEDFERIRREYLPTLAARRARLLAGHAPVVPDDKSSQDIVLSIWQSSCEYLAQHPMSPAMRAL